MLKYPTYWMCVVGVVLSTAGCSGAYYGAMEKVGVHKRDILVDRVAEGRDAQSEAKEEFENALERFRATVNVEGGDLEQQYRELSAVLKRSESKAQEVHERIESIEDVSAALFKEWRAEIKTYNSASLKASSQRQYDATLGRYDELIRAMQRAEAKMDPVLVVLRDQVLFLKHNLNARAIASLKTELSVIETSVDELLAEMDAAIREADMFIQAMNGIE